MAIYRMVYIHQIDSRKLQKINFVWISRDHSVQYLSSGQTSEQHKKCHNFPATKNANKKQKQNATYTQNME